MRHNKNITLMYIIVFLQGLVFYGSVATVYRQAKGLTMADIFLIESVSWILLLLLEVPWGWFADRFGYKRTLVIANFVFFLSKFVFFTASTFSFFLMERVLLSVALAGLSGCDLTLLHLAKAPEADSERIFARYKWFATSGLLVASLVSPLILRFSLEATAFLTIIPYGLAFSATLFLTDIRGSRNEKPSIRKSIRSILSHKRFLLFVVSAALVAEAVQSVTVFLNQLQYQKSGIGIAYYGPLLALMQVIRLITVKSHWLSRRFGRIRSAAGLFAIIFICCAGLILTSSPMLSIILIGLIGGSMAMAEPMIIDEQNRSVTGCDRATILSLYSMCGSILAAAVNPLIGIGADRSVESGLALCACICAAAVLMIFVYFLLTRHQRKGELPVIK